MKQDMNGVRTAQDLERKYDLKSMVGLKKAVKLQEEGINKTNSELEQFMSSTLNNIDNLQTQIDGNITTYYYSGVPTLSNIPASEWGQSKYNVHLGDLYYDKDTGYAYRFYLDSENNEYGWLKITDSDVTEALALANSANDTADSKRRVFVVQPNPPYDNGDLWFNAEEIYICQISKSSSEEYAEGDFIIATKYTDDTVANKIGNELTVLQGTVTTIKESVDSYKISFDTSINILNNQTQQNLEKIENMSYTFDTEDLTISNSNSPNSAVINNNGMKLYTYNNLKLISNQNGTGIQKLIAVGDAQIGYLRFVKELDEKNKECTDIHHLVSNIQTLQDLEVENSGNV